MSESNISKGMTLLGRLGWLTFANPRGLREVCGVALSASGQVLDPALDVLPVTAVCLEDLVDEESATLAFAVKPKV
jgi:hypothetical protein